MPGETFKDALAKIDMEFDYSPDRGWTHTILGLKEVEAAHRAEVERHTARIARLEAALRFYADASNYGQSHGADCGQVYTGDGNVEEYHGGDCGMPEVMRDDGAKARAALEEPRRGDTTEAAEGEVKP